MGKPNAKQNDLVFVLEILCKEICFCLVTIIMFFCF